MRVPSQFVELPGSIEKLGDLTVLEDEESLVDDDEDIYDDDDDAESGDWYRDYDTRRPKVNNYLALSFYKYLKRKPA